MKPMPATARALAKPDAAALVRAKPEEIALGFPAGMKLLPTGLILPDGLKFPQWDRVGMTLRQIGGAIQWWWGDWLRYGESRYGEKHAQAEVLGEAYGRSPRTIQNAAFVAGRFEVARRRANVDWSTHAALAGVEGDERLKLLHRAEKEGWTVAQAREAVRDINGNGADRTDDVRMVALTHIRANAAGVRLEWDGGAMILSPQQAKKIWDIARRRRSVSGHASFLQGR